MACVALGKEELAGLTLAGADALIIQTGPQAVIVCGNLCIGMGQLLFASSLRAAAEGRGSVKKPKYYREASVTRQASKDRPRLSPEERRGGEEAGIRRRGGGGEEEARRRQGGCKEEGRRAGVWGWRRREGRAEEQQ
eukprot:2651116-Rhodomonas_salina.2